MSEKLLSRPPFKYLFDVVIATMKATKFAEGLYSESELDANVYTNKEPKLKFLQKIIDLTQMVNGKQLDVKPSKIVAGQEAEKTNEWLQGLYSAATSGKDFKSAVKQILAADSGAHAPEAKAEEPKPKQKEPAKEEPKPKPKEPKPEKKEAPKEPPKEAPKPKPQPPPEEKKQASPPEKKQPPPEEKPKKVPKHKVEEPQKNEEEPVEKPQPKIKPKPKEPPKEAPPKEQNNEDEAPKTKANLNDLPSLDKVIFHM